MQGIVSLGAKAWSPNVPRGSTFNSVVRSGAAYMVEPNHVAAVASAHFTVVLALPCSSSSPNPKEGFTYM